MPPDVPVATVAGPRTVALEPPRTSARPRCCEPPADCSRWASTRKHWSTSPEARPLDPDSATLAQLTATAEEQRAVADTRAQRSAAFRDHLAAASELLAKQDLQHAAKRIAEARELRPDDAEARGLETSITRALKERGAAPSQGERRGTSEMRGKASPSGPKPAKPPSRRKRPADDGESDLLEE